MCQQVRETRSEVQTKSCNYRRADKRSSLTDLKDLIMPPSCSVCSGFIFCRSSKGSRRGARGRPREADPVRHVQRGPRTCKNSQNVDACTVHSKRSVCSLCWTPTSCPPYTCTWRRWPSTRRSDRRSRTSSPASGNGRSGWGSRQYQPRISEKR